LRKAARSPVEFGDFQTPPRLAGEVCRFLADRGVSPATVVEPTCGLGHFVLAALQEFRTAGLLGYELNEAYVESLRDKLALQVDGRGQIIQSSFFDLDWTRLLGRLTQPILAIGNPPWVTNSQLGALGGSNLPPKSNQQRLSGIDALTGKSNFDISEWMLIQLMVALSGHDAWLAMLCKTAVARKVLQVAWKRRITIDWAELRIIDAARWFGVAVDACLLVAEFSRAGTSTSCAVFSGFQAEEPRHVFGLVDGRLIADHEAYGRSRHLAGESLLRWRSGIKHDAAKVMELRREAEGYRNGLGERVELEDEFVFPLLKSSAIAKEQSDRPTRWMIVPQKGVGDDPEAIRTLAPKTWKYLTDHREAFDRRASSIYRNRPAFSIFGVGDYSFLPWKVAISGFYKQLQFHAVGPVEGKPVVFDDTVYFTAFQTEANARFVASLLNSEAARGFFRSIVFWDAKRPITAELLHRIDLRPLARELGWESELDRLNLQRPPV